MWSLVEPTETLRQNSISRNLKHDSSVYSYYKENRPEWCDYQIYPVNQIPYTDINQWGLRCDPLDEIKNADKIFVFLGCSITFGTSIMKEDTWAWKTYQVIKSKYPNSKIPYINLSLPGTGIEYSIRMLENLIKKYNIKQIDGVFYMNYSFPRTELIIENGDNLTNINFLVNKAYFDESIMKARWLAHRMHHIVNIAEYYIDNSIRNFRYLKTLCKSVNCDFLKIFVLVEDDRALKEKQIITKHAEIESHSLECDNLPTPLYKHFGVGTDLCHLGPKFHDFLLNKNPSMLADLP